VAGKELYRVCEVNNRQWLIERKENAAERERKRLEGAERQRIELLAKQEKERIDHLLGQAHALHQKERSTGITPRSNDLIDYTNFGELREIIKANWEIFGDTFDDIRAVERVLGNLNTLRAPIARCKALAEDEVLRLHLGLRDWFRQME
jgi:hypothetical protein